MCGGLARDVTRDAVCFIIRLFMQPLLRIAIRGSSWSVFTVTWLSRNMAVTCLQLLDCHVTLLLRDWVCQLRFLLRVYSDFVSQSTWIGEALVL